LKKNIKEDNTMSQAKRYATLQALTERENEKLDCSYHAAFYLLSGFSSVYFYPHLFRKTF